MGALIARILMALGLGANAAKTIGNAATLAAILYVLKKILEFCYRVVSYPLALVAICAALTLFPDTIGWIFLKIGEIELRVMAIVLSVVMPDIFNAGAGSYTEWAQIWQEGINLLPSDMVDIINGLGVAYLLGLITNTIGAVFAIRIYRRAMLRAGLL